MTGIRSLLFAFIFIFPQGAFAKSYSPYYADACSWNTFNVSYKLNRQYTLLFTEELRFRENYSRLNLFYTNLGLEYRISRYFKTSLVYRWIDKYTDENRFSFRHRLMWDVGAKYPMRKWGVSYRHRLQTEVRNVYSSNDGGVAEWYSRNKVELSYKFNTQWTAYVSDEMRFQLSDPRAIESDLTWHRDRYAAGIEYDYSSKSKFGIYYLIQREYNVSMPENLYVTGLEYSLSLGR